MESPTDGRAGRGADPAPAANVPLSLSLNRIARLKRYDMSWQAALGDTRRRQALRRGKNRARDTQRHHSIQSRGARDRYGEDRMS